VTQMEASTAKQLHLQALARVEQAAAEAAQGGGDWRAEKCCRGTGLPISWIPAAHF